MRGVRVAGFAGMLTLGVMAPVIAMSGGHSSVRADDPACDWLGWRHPACAGGSFDSPLPNTPAGIGALPDNGGQMVPNIDGSLSLPGTPGAI